MTDMSPEDLNALQKTAFWVVRSGYYDREAALAKVTQSAGDAGYPNFETAELVDTQIESLTSDQASWSGKTDSERLSEAFDILRKDGVMALENFGLGPSDAMADLREKVGQARAAGEVVSGYMMFNEQRTQDCVQGYPILSLQYGIPENDVSEARAVEFAQKIVAALEGAGLTVKWDGDPRDVIEIRLVWRARWDA